jgi:hypothetical protein
MQKSIDAATPYQKMMVVKCIAENTLIFVMDPYANYVVQFVLNLQIPEIN